MTDVKVDHLYFRYGHMEILHDISVVFDKPELVCILGPNGVGKTTIAKCLNKLNKPTSGTVTLDGVDISGMRRSEIAKKVAFVPNSAKSVFSMTVLESILMGRIPVSGYGTSEKDIEVVGRVIRMMDLDDLSARDVNELSAGQTQRVTIARGLAQEPKVIILDEPTSNLDVRYQMEVMRFLKSYASDEGVIVVMVCHDLNITAAYADRVILMHEGRIFADGTVEEVLTQENLKTVYRIDTKVLQVDGVTHILQIPL